MDTRVVRKKGGRGSSRISPSGQCKVRWTTSVTVKPSTFTRVFYLVFSPSGPLLI
jgi:hypothetical protein